ncbi:MAG: hydroxyacid dehydrogenase [Phycisphaeraceae bacterium]
MAKGYFVLGRQPFDRIYSEQLRGEIERCLDGSVPHHTADEVQANPALLHDADVVLSGWGGPRFDQALLDAAPNLKIVLYGAGSIRNIVTDAFWQRGVHVCSAWAANAVPVAEFTFAQVILCLKRAWHFARETRELGTRPADRTVPGAYGSTVGVIGLGQIGRLVCNWLKTLDVHVIAYDPYADEAQAAALGVELVSLEALFQRSDVATLHAPNLPETRGMITGEHFASMKPSASFINTARGALVREEEMIDVLRRRPDVYAVLDVTCPEPPEPGSPLYELPNVVLTPHIAGSQGRECHRMGRYMLDELKRWLANEPLQWEVTQQQAALMA